MLKCGVDAWTLNGYCEQKLEAFEIWTYRRILRIPWTEYVTNVEVLRRTEKGVMGILHELKKRKMQYLGHVMRGQWYEILQFIIHK